MQRAKQAQGGTTVAASHGLSEEEIIRGFHELYYYWWEKTWQNTTWLGVMAWKCPLDLWIYQEILVETKPDIVIECGTLLGGSALFLASVCDMVGKGRVITIDMASKPNRPTHTRITYMQGSSVEPETIERVKSLLKGGETVMVILDSDHACDHVLQEMRLYGNIVTPGHYLIVEDTNIGHPIFPSYIPGPREAVQRFLAERTDFVPDITKEKFLMTFNPGGYLRKTIAA